MLLNYVDFGYFSFKVEFICEEKIEALYWDPILQESYYSDDRLRPLIFLDIFDKDYDATEFQLKLSIIKIL